MILRLWIGFGSCDRSILWFLICMVLLYLNQNYSYSMISIKRIVTPSRFYQSKVSTHSLIKLVHHFPIHRIRSYSTSVLHKTSKDTETHSNRLFDKYNTFKKYQRSRWFSSNGSMFFLSNFNETRTINDINNYSSILTDTTTNASSTQNGFMNVSTSLRTHIQTLIKTSLLKWNLSISTLSSDDLTVAMDRYTNVLTNKIISDSYLSIVSESQNAIENNSSNNSDSSSNEEENDMFVISQSKMNREVIRRGEFISEALNRYFLLTDSFVTIDDIILHRISIESIVDKYCQYHRSNQQIFEDIRSLHSTLKRRLESYPTDYTVKDGVVISSPCNLDRNIINNLDDEVNDRDMSSLQKYGLAAQLMGSKDWVRKGNEWMMSFAYNYFRRNGARRAYINHILSLSISLRQNRQNNSSSNSNSNSNSYINNNNHSNNQISRLGSILADGIGKDLVRDLMSNVNNNSNASSHSDSKDRKIRLLDVGSCYNPFLHMNERDSFDITAIDIYPTHKSVYKCDFLNLSIGSQDSVPIYGKQTKSREEKDSLDLSNELIQLPKESYDVITMSLVLSYLPSPDQRIAMIRKARELLVSPGYQGHPHYSGLLLIVEKSSIFRHTSKNKSNSKNSKIGNYRKSEEQSNINDLSHNNLLFEWKQAIEDCGFELVKYMVLRDNNNGNDNNNNGNDSSIEKLKGSHLFAFRAIDRMNVISAASSTASSSNNTTELFSTASNSKKYHLWIRQDFVSTKTESKKLNNNISENIEPSNILHSTQALLSNLSSSNLTEVSISSYKKNDSENSHQYPIVIIGGGIGGSALALALQQRNIPMRIFEKDPCFDSRKQGYALTMQQAAITLSALGLSEDIKKIGVRSYAHQSNRYDGRMIGCYGPLVRNGKILEDSYTQWPNQRILSHVLNSTDVTDSSIDMVSDTITVKNVDSMKQLFVEEISIKDYVQLLQSKVMNRHNIHIPRQTLRQLMVKHINPESISWNKKLVKYVEHHFDTNRNGNVSQMNKDYVSLYFDDNEVVNASLVIAADGIHSTITKQLLSSETLENHSIDSNSSPNPIISNRLHYLGLMVILGISPIQSITSFQCIGQNLRKQIQWVDGSKRLFAMPYDDSYTMWQLSYPVDEKQAIEITTKGSEVLKSEALKVCYGWDRNVISLIECTEKYNISGHPAYDRDPMTMDELNQYRSTSSRVTFLGDSMHPMSPFKGQGANQALLDALGLAKAIASSNLISPSRRPIGLALRAYEEEMLSRSKGKVIRSREAAVYLHSPSALAEGNITRTMAAETMSHTLSYELNSINNNLSNSHPHPNISIPTSSSMIRE